jgi:hypothetical protein
MSKPRLLFGSILCAALLALVAPSLAAQGTERNGQRVRALDDPVVADIEDILVESGSLFLSYAAPYSDGELRAALDRVDPDKLSVEGRAKYAEALAALHPDPGYRSGELAAKAGVEVNLDGNWRSDENVPWVLGYQERPSFLSVPVEAWAGSGAYGYFEPAWRRDYYSVNLPVSQLSVPNYTSVPIDVIGSDTSFPFRSFGAAGGDFWSFRVGRDKLSLGSMGENNIIVSARPEWYDYARLTLFFPDFQYSAYMVQLDTERNLYMHHADILLFDRLSIGITEGILVGDDSPELRFFNPLMIFHGYEAWNDETIAAGDTTTGGVATLDTTSGVGSMLGVELDYTPARYVTVVAQYQFNAGQDPLKMIFWPGTTETIPNSSAFLLGAKLRAPYRGGYIKGELCGVYTEPYDMILSNDDVSYIYRRDSNSSYPGGDIQEWIGFPDGPDCILVSASLGYETASRESLGLSASYEWKGDIDNGNFDTPYAWSLANAGLTTPSGIVQGRLQIGVDAGLPIGEHWKAQAAVYYTHRVNADNVSGQDDQSVELMAGVSLSL